MLLPLPLVLPLVLVLPLLLALFGTDPDGTDEAVAYAATATKPVQGHNRSLHCIRKVTARPGRVKVRWWVVFVARDDDDDDDVEDDDGVEDVDDTSIISYGMSTATAASLVPSSLVSIHCSFTTRPSTPIELNKVKLAIRG